MPKNVIHTCGTCAYQDSLIDDYPCNVCIRHTGDRDIWEPYPLNSKEAKIERMREMLITAENALRSFQYGNSSTEFAKNIADNIQALLQVV